MLNNPLRYIDPTGRFTDDAIRDYLQNLYGVEWQNYWDAWSADEAWWNFITTAQANDIFAQGPQLYMFAGTGEVELTGVGIVLTGESPKPHSIQSHEVNSFFLGAHGVRVSNLIRPMSAGGYEVVSTMPFYNYGPSTPYGSLKSSVSLQYHQVTEGEAIANYLWHTATLAAIVWGGARLVGVPPKFAKIVGIAFPILKETANIFLDYTVSDYGTNTGDMRFYLVTDVGSLGPYTGGSTSTTLMWGREMWK